MGVRERKWKQHESTIVALHRRCVARLQMNGRRFQKGGGEREKKVGNDGEKYCVCRDGDCILHNFN